MKKIIIIVLVLFLTSCGLFKNTEKQRQKQKSISIEKGIRVVEIPSDSIVYRPKIRYINKDTTIIVENKNLILKTRHHKGVITNIKAIQKPKKEITKYEKKENKKIKVTDYKSEGAKLKPIYFLYLFLGLGFLILVNNLTKRK